ncbi:MAG: hypothetical protein EBT92_08910 [Planctomycetes bacterium]|nr:hypothetical protein [Planctomycetota bacterium]NBY02929.1 hypothetical protein [Planctomycetota bacterium]
MDIHCDVKPDNHHHCYLIDFSSSKPLFFDRTNRLTSINTVLGSPMCMAPKHKKIILGDILLEIINQNPVLLTSRYTISVIFTQFKNYH